MRRPSISGIALGLVAGGITAFLAYSRAIRPWHMSWGASEEEANRRLPGDDLVPNPKFKATHAITIRASAAQIWPWLVQIGQGRAGFYSYDWIENLMGLNINSADQIVRVFQGLQLGDRIPLAPGFGIPVAILDPGRALVLHGDTRLESGSTPFVMKPGEYLNVTWGFFLDEYGPDTTRLVERFQADYNPSAQNTLFYRIFLEPGSFVMEQQMLRGIKERVERSNLPNHR